MEIPGQEVWPEDQRDETGAGLADLGTEFEYLYDFGDGWTHDVEVLGRGGSAPGCVDGHRPARPKIGGPGDPNRSVVLAENGRSEHGTCSPGSEPVRPLDAAQ